MLSSSHWNGPQVERRSGRRKMRQLPWLYAASVISRWAELERSPLGGVRQGQTSNTLAVAML